MIELRDRPVRDALRAAERPLREIGRALGSGREIVIVPGNHDHHLAAGWIERRARDGAPAPLGLESPVQWLPQEPLGQVAEWLAPATVSAAYPGIWLREDTYATHGHYCDRHTTVPMLERLGAGVMARIVGEPPGGAQCAEDYEATLAPLYAWIDAIAQADGPGAGRGSHGASARAWRALGGGGARRSLRRRGLAVAFPAIVAGLNRARLGPLRADLSVHELRAAALHAFAEVLGRLRVDASHVIFGHTHRAGPLPGDEPGEWITPTGVRMLNTGSWVHEPGFLGQHPPTSPYRPGFCAVLDDTRPPELRNLLDGSGDAGV